MAFTTFEFHRKDLDKYLETNVELRAKLEAPVREMVVEASKFTLRQKDLPKHEAEQEMFVEDANDDWLPGFEFRDEIRDQMGREDDFDDALLDDDEG